MGPSRKHGSQATAGHDDQLTTSQSTIKNSQGLEVAKADQIADMHDD